MADDAYTRSEFWLFGRLGVSEAGWLGGSAVWERDTGDDTGWRVFYFERVARALSPSRYFGLPHKLL